jgi:glutamyl-tRNA synthetase
MKKIRTRFAPSPTGFLHIGGLRTALFAFLFARHGGGDFLLRIEDTDRTRLVDGAVEDIIESLRWIGIDWDEGPDKGGPRGPYLQSARKETYSTHALELVEKGNAYRCFCTSERLEALRGEQKKTGSFQGYDRLCRSLTAGEIAQNLAKGMPWVVRLKVPLDGDTVFSDGIRGEIRTPNTTLDDLVLLKSDGFPTYHLANVVDDHLMEVTHVIRGDEWISSTPRHVILYAAFGWETPLFAHVPVILDQGGGKLSKRHGATMVREFRERGYVAEALLNFIALLGWSYDDKTVLFSMDELVRAFDLAKVNKSPAVFSHEKLDWFNGVYIRSKSTEELYDALIPYLVRGGIVDNENDPETRAYIVSIIPLIRERLKTLGDACALTWFFFDAHFQVKDRGSLVPKKLDGDAAKKILHGAAEGLEEAEPFTEEAAEKALRGLVQKLGLKAGDVFMAVRVAITGTTVSPGLFETMRVLGRKRVLKRLKSAVALLP